MGQAWVTALLHDPAEAAAGAARMSPARQRLVRDIALIMIAPFLLYLLVCLFTFSPQDPGWSHSGSVTAPLENAGGRVGAWLADVLLYLCGYVAFVLPLIKSFDTGARESGRYRERVDAVQALTLRQARLEGAIMPVVRVGR